MSKTLKLTRGTDTKPDTTARLTLESSPQWQAAQAKADALEARARGVQDRIRRIQAELFTINNRSGPESPLDIKAKALLEDDYEAETTPERTTLAQQLRAAEEEARVVARAKDLHRDAVEHLRRELSPRIVEQYRQEHQDRARRIATALGELAAALREELQFRSRMDDLGVHHLSLMPLLMPLFVSLLELDQGGAVAQWCSDMVGSRTLTVEELAALKAG
jgi:hypothetical protein